VASENDNMPCEQSQNERLRLAHELHDGLLQTLTGLTLQLEVALQLVGSDPRAARAHIREIQQLIVDRQRELREWIDDARHPNRHSAKPVELAVVLDTLCRRVSRWGPRVELVTNGSERISSEIGDHVYRIVEEGLSNITRHAHAQMARVEVGVRERFVRIVIADDGSGFSFRGRYDLATLEARRLGPRSLKERVASLGGKLVLASTLSGSTLEIELPLHEEQGIPVAGHRVHSRQGQS
jgi:signal transduction histidine kinase